MKYQLAQINVARMRGVNLDDPIMREFKENIDAVNALAESAEGFVWRLKDESDNAMSFRPYEDEQILINVSVWKDVSSLEKFTYQTFHSSFVKRRKEWFQKYGEAHYALWWIPQGELPTLDDCVARLEHLQSEGPSSHAFTFKKVFPPA